ncbi:MAG: ABC transporter ATP-binding protein [Desulfitobacterium sp.]|nr:ABC transporter ATP-binding protein [Desulfitobacterium sp.]
MKTTTISYEECFPLVLKLVGISVAIKGKSILEEINLEVKEGEFISLLGPSGCGKSTLLKTIAGLLTQQSGDVLMGQKNVNDLPANERGAVIVFQDLRLFPNMTIAENVAFPLKLKGVPKAERLAKAKELLERVQLAGYEKRKTSEMSGGQLQRVALARAMAANPRILLLDEPFSSLDESLRQDMRRLVLDLHKEFGMTTVLVTHDQEEALMMSDKVAVMMEGRLIQYDTPQVIYDQPASVAVADFFGGGNYISGKVQGNTFYSNQVSFPLDKPDGDYLALFRPSTLGLVPKKRGYHITEMNYLGGMWDLKVEGQGRVFSVRKVGEHPYKIGDETGLEFDISRAIIFNKSQ